MSKSLGSKEIEGQLNTGKKLAVVLFNLGGPDDLKSVKQFLFNLFYDKAIIRLPNPLRFIIAKLISSRREKTAQQIYAQIGGKSPILQQTEAQKEALTLELAKNINHDFRIFIAMRHWNPRSVYVVRKIKEYDPSEIVMLPLYPQFSTTTSGSSIDEFIKEMERCGLKNKLVKRICCYPDNEKFIDSHISSILESIAKLKSKDNFRILFSAHGLPVSVIKEGDPYQWQVELSVQKIVDKLKIPNLDYKITYQSRVGPLQWLKPNTDEEIEAAGREGKNLVIVPIAFVSEHVETLVELDIEYYHLAEKYGVEYIRVPTLGVEKNFIEALAELVVQPINDRQRIRICPERFGKCKCEL